MSQDLRFLNQIHHDLALDLYLVGRWRGEESKVQVSSQENTTAANQLSS